eukprot:GGOE01018504.1.p1 GENE.GGOE01018504.1~~GGOE01018504.1.p1  ORF type:complete len:502 (+),score=140.74 GGOE01018504.1:87-1592(+)
MVEDDTTFSLANMPVGSASIRVPGDFLEIHAALEAARPGDFICLESGEYSLLEPLVVEKEVHLMGSEDGIGGGTVVTFDRRSKALLNPDVHLLTVAAPSVRISRITFRHFEGPGRERDPPRELVFCLFLRQGNVLVDNCHVESTFASCIGVASECRPTITLCHLKAREYGVFCCREAVPRLKANQVSACQTGLYFDDGTMGTVEENALSGCVFGMEVVQRASPAMLRNAVDGCTGAGLYISSGSPTAPRMLVRANHFRSNAVGVLIENCANPVLEKNVIEGSESCGVQVGANGGGELLFNDIIQNAVGILLEGGSATRVVKNVIRDSGRCGVQVRGRGTRGLLKDNEVVGNHCGIAVEDAAAPLVAQNRISGSKEWGLRITGTQAAKVVENEVFDNPGHGLEITQSVVEVSHNRITRNKGRGLALIDCPSGEFTGNLITQNGAAGVDVSGCRDIRISTTTVSENTMEGLLVHNQSAVHLSENTMSGNGNENIYASLDSVIS